MSGGKQTKLDVTTQRIMETLTGDWQDAKDIMPKLMGTVAPGKALRTNKVRQAWKPPVQTRLTTDEAKLDSGARTVVNARLAVLRRYGKVEIERFNGVRMLRLSPSEAAQHKADGCPACGHSTHPDSEHHDLPSQTILEEIVQTWHGMAGDGD